MDRPGAPIEDGESLPLTPAAPGEPLVVEAFLEGDLLAALRAHLERVPRIDGRVSAGAWARSVKRCAMADPRRVESAGVGLSERIMAYPAIARPHLPVRATRPVFLRYAEGDAYGLHEDNVLQAGLRADLSYTLWITGDGDFDGGELVLGSGEGARTFRPTAGTLVVYESGSRHEVRPVRSGVRWVAVGWLQSAVRSAADRRLLARFASALHGVERARGLTDPSFVELNAIRNELLRRWAAP